MLEVQHSAPLSETDSDDLNSDTKTLPALWAVNALCNYGIVDIKTEIKQLVLN